MKSKKAKISIKKQLFSSLKSKRQRSIALILTFVLLFAIIAGAVRLYETQAATPEGFTQSAEDNQFNGINSHRGSHGLWALKRSGCLTDIARAWTKHMAQSMSANGYGLAHSSWDGSSPNHKEFRYYQQAFDYSIQVPSQCSHNTYALIAENVGVSSLYSSSREDIIKGSEGLMTAYLNSDGHHRNIDGVNSGGHRVDYVGVGAYVMNDRLWTTQIFVACVNDCSAWDVPPSKVGEPGQPLPPPPPPTPGQDRLIPGQKLTENQKITSKNGKYFLIMQGDGNLVVYQNEPRKYLWNSTTYDSPGSHAVFQTDGNFVVYKKNGGACHTLTYGKNGSRIVMQDDGNLVMYRSDNSVVWASRGSYWYC